MSYTFLQAQGEAFSADSFSDIPPCVLSRLNLTAAKSCSNDNATGCSRASQSGMTCEPSTEHPGGGTLMSSQAGSPAKTSALQAKERESAASAAGSGWKWPESSMKYDPDTSSWRTRQRSLLGGLAEFSETWPKWGLMRAGECLELTTPAHPISVIDSGYSDAFPTPTVHGNHNRKGLSKSSGDGLSTFVKKFPTPVADGDRATNYAQGGTSLGYAARTFPTPTASASKGTSPGTLTRKDGRSRKNDRLDHRVLADAIEESFPTPQARDFRTGQRKRYDDPKRQNNLNDAIGGKLNPTWVAWLMGWPLAWTDLKPLAMDKYQQWQRSHGARSEGQ